MNHGLDRLATLPLSLRLIKEIHCVLLENVRGADKQPGEFRSSSSKPFTHSSTAMGALADCSSLCFSATEGCCGSRCCI